MPELPEVDAVRRALAPVLVGSRVVAVDLRRPDLRAPFPPRFAERLAGQAVAALTRRAKFLVATLSSGEALLMHLGMSGSFRLEPDAAPATGPGDRHDHVVLHLSSGWRVVFNDPRRFGSMTLVEPGDLTRHPVLSRLGPEPLSDAFDAAALARCCRKTRVAIKVRLLDQRVVAGLGNIYASEALFLARVSPRRRASTLATAAGAPVDRTHRVTRAIKQVLTVAIARATAGGGSRFRVYDREDQPCPRARCGGRIGRIVQAGQSTFFCQTCQR